MMNGNENGKWPLPEGWVWTTLGDVADIVMGQSPPSSTYNTEGIGLPFYQGKAEFGPMYPTTVKWCSKPNKISEPGDVLMSVRAPVGSTNLNRERSCIGRGLAAIRPPKSMNPLYILYWLRLSEQDLVDQSTGTTFQAISGKVVRSHPLPLPPLPTQHRIVAEIEKQFTRLDAAVAALRRAKANLARYKAAVLKAAVEGRLVPQTSEVSETSEVLLARILAERRAQWEAANPKKKYVEPKRPDVAGLPALPEGWVWATVEEVADVRSGFAFKSNEFIERGSPVIKIANVGYGEFFWKDQEYLPEQYLHTYKQFEIYPGTILLALTRPITNGTVKVCRYPVNAPIALLNQRVSALLVRNSHPLSDFLFYWLQSEKCKEQIEHGLSETLQPNLSPNTLARFHIAIPPLQEQRQIVEEVERRLSVIQSEEQVIAANSARADRLRQAVLARAFRGELVANGDGETAGETSEVF